ncbi:MULTISPECIES: BRO-N domain-containing protein [Chelativorans]|jgi:hypothetical protein|uniref:BRO-N domain-containing protein n=1 Tax=Chelativorans TaxID=449972 RepID=UPI0005A2813E
MTCDVMFPSAAAIQAAVGITDVIGRQQKTTIINESGLYSVILQSSKPKAKRFRKWITSEVLPTIGRPVLTMGACPPSFGATMPIGTALIRVTSL